MPRIWLKRKVFKNHYGNNTDPESMEGGKAMQSENGNRILYLDFELANTKIAIV